MPLQIWAVNVHKFLKDDPNDLAHLLQFVNEDARKEIRAYRHPQDAYRKLRSSFQAATETYDCTGSLVGRLLPKAFVSREYGIPWSEIDIIASQYNRPYLLNKLDQKLDFNISHDGDWAVMAIYSAENFIPQVGIDVMEIRIPWPDSSLPDFSETLREQMTLEERQTLAEIPDEKKIEWLVSLWTHKEALVKAMGMGLHFEMNRLSFTLPCDRHDTIRLEIDGVENNSWKFVEALLGESYNCVVAYRNASHELVLQGTFAHYAMPYELG